jgi:TRAP-type mannitol/chloroaromatic compound transport system permease small subunit
VYQQQSTSPFHLFYLLGLLFFLLPTAVVVVLVGLLIGVLWRLYRRLGRPTGWADH